jgi:hypothetical protein
MILVESSSQTKRFRKSPWFFQKTFRTPLKKLPAFVADILVVPGAVGDGIVTIESTVFTPVNLGALLGLHSLAMPSTPDQGIKAANSAEVSDLLEAAFGDAIDFWFVPNPKTFAIYADHDEYVTFFANKKAALTAQFEALLSHGVIGIENYERKL